MAHNCVNIDVDSNIMSYRYQSAFSKKKIKSLRWMFYKLNENNTDNMKVNGSPIYSHA